MQKARGRTGLPCGAIVLPLLVDARFQVLFHSPNRGAFHLSLTVLVHCRSSSVFSLGGWAPQLPAGLACPAVLRIQTSASLISCTGLSPSSVGFPNTVPLSTSPFCLSYNPSPAEATLVWASRHYSRNNLFSSGYLDVSVPRVPRSPTMCSSAADQAFPWPGFPIRISVDQHSSAIPHSFSQRYTSFFGT